MSGLLGDVCGQRVASFARCLWDLGSERAQHKHSLEKAAGLE